MALKQTSGRVFNSWLNFSSRFGASGYRSVPASLGGFHSLSSSSEEERNAPSSVSSAEVRSFVDNKMKNHPLGLGSVLGSPMPLHNRSQVGKSAAFPGSWAAQTAQMSSVRQVQSGSLVNSLMVGVYKFWRSQAPHDKAPAPIDNRMLPAVVQASDERANVGMWATTFFCTIIACNVMGLIPFNEAPTSGLGFATGLGIATWATATALGFSKLGFTFPGHFIPGGTPWQMALIFVPLETISYSFRAVSLGVRLWVNMLAGHTLLSILTGMSLAMPFSLPFYSAIPSTFAICCLLSALVGLEYLVAVLQSGVFAILSTVYVGEFNATKLAAPLARMIKH